MNIFDDVFDVWLICVEIALSRLKKETGICRNTVSCCAMCVVTTEKLLITVIDKTYAILVLVLFVQC
jgi:hypothetical protein